PTRSTTKAPPAELRKTERSADQAAAPDGRVKADAGTTLSPSKLNKTEGKVTESTPKPNKSDSSDVGRPNVESSLDRRGRPESEITRRQRLSQLRQLLKDA